MGYVKRELSLAQNIDELFWGKSPRLRDEFDRLFDSAFDAPDEISHRMTTLAENLPKKFAIHPTIITTFGLKKGMYSSVFVRKLTMESFFSGE